MDRQRKVELYCPLMAVNVQINSHQNEKETKTPAHTHKKKTTTHRTDRFMTH